MSRIRSQQKIHFVRERAHYRCEYCHLPYTLSPSISFHVDHIDPDGGDDISNLAFSCASCNSHKSYSTSINIEGKNISLFNPRSQKWADHFEWSQFSQSYLSHKTLIGKATIQKLQINNTDIQIHRKIVFPKPEDGMESDVFYLVENYKNLIFTKRMANELDDVRQYANYIFNQCFPIISNKRYCSDIEKDILFLYSQACFNESSMQSIREGLYIVNHCLSRFHDDEHFISQIYEHKAVFLNQRELIFELAGEKRRGYAKDIIQSLRYPIDRNLDWSDPNIVKIVANYGAMLSLYGDSRGELQNLIEKMEGLLSENISDKSIYFILVMRLIDIYYNLFKNGLYIANMPMIDKLLGAIDKTIILWQHVSFDITLYSLLQRRNIMLLNMCDSNKVEPVIYDAQVYAQKHNLNNELRGIEILRRDAMRF